MAVPSAFSLGALELMVGPCLLKAPRTVFRRHWRHGLVGLVVKASASRAEDPGFVGIFSGVESYQ